MSQTLERTAAMMPTQEAAGEPAPRRWTRAEYLRLTEAGILGPDERVELLGGEIFRMAAQKNRHAAAVTLAARECNRCFPAGHWVRVQATLAVGGEYSMPEPDVAVILGEIRDHPEDYPDSALLVIEASETTLAYDRGRKAGLYASAGIADYWVQNLAEGTLEVRRDPAPKAGTPFGWEYADVSVFRKGETVTPLAAPGCEIPVGDLLP
jgi:Uma2 family endonuclease